jgi:dUTP pyrophosphatase
MPPRLAVPVKFKRLHEKAVIPQYQTEGAACVDLVVTGVNQIDEDKVELSFGFAAEISEGYKVFLMPRSSFTHKGWVMQNSPGVIDHDYRGEWKVRFQAIPIGVVHTDQYGNIKLIYEEVPYKVGDRAVQASIEVNIHMRFREVKEELGHTLRGEGGFGHTGK